MHRFLMVIAILFSSMATAEGLNIAVVDMERALFNSDEAKQSAEQFQSKVASDIKRIKSLEAELIAMDEQIKNDSAVMSPDQIGEAKGKRDALYKEYQYYAREMQQRNNEWQKGFFQSKLPQMERILKELIDAEKYDLVLPAGAVVYASPAVDLTAKLLERLNAK